MSAFPSARNNEASNPVYSDYVQSYSSLGGRASFVSLDWHQLSTTKMQVRTHEGTNKEVH